MSCKKENQDRELFMNDETGYLKADAIVRVIRALTSATTINVTATATATTVAVTSTASTTSPLDNEPSKR